MNEEKKYKYITIKQDDGYGLYHGKPVYEIINNKTGNIMGNISYYKYWKQFVFSAVNIHVIFNNECLKDIIDFMEAL